jgi:AcrR family transcriptional regulator
MPVPTERRRAKRVSRDERCAELLEAARQVFTKKGYHAATVDDITRTAGVAKGTFYLYFNEKRAIFIDLIQHFFDMVAEIGRSVAQDVRTPADYFAQAERAAGALAALFRDKRDLVRLVYRESMGLDEELEHMVRGFYRRMAEVEAENIRVGTALGLFRGDIDPMVAAYAHIGLVERVLLEAVFDRGFPAGSDLVKQLMILAHSGLRRREAPEAKEAGAAG